MYKKIFILQIIQAVFIDSLLLIGVLEKSNIILSKANFTPFCILSILIFWFIFDIISIVNMNKNKNHEKKIFKYFVFLTIEAFLTGLFCCIIDYNKDIIEFSKHCQQTTATIYHVNKDIQKKIKGVQTLNESDIDFRRSHEYYDTVFTYRFHYSANDEYHESYFVEHNETKMLYKAEKIKPNYSIYDTLPIYYNTQNPSDWKISLSQLRDRYIYVLAIVTIAIQVYSLRKAKKDLDVNIAENSSDNLK